MTECAPILLLVFNRPAETARVFQAISRARPERLYIAADGPRPDRPGEAERCAEVREAVAAVDWPCTVKTLFREQNLGCKAAVSDAISWFFAQETAGIVLEDDCLPHPDFFPYCSTLLEHYAEDERVAMITGDNFQQGQRRGDAAYYFSRYPHVWGWASWRRAWRHYQGDMAFWPHWKRSPEWRALFADGAERGLWEGIFDRMHAQAIDSWAYCWLASTWYTGGLTATPNANLISNIGFGEGATHTLAGSADGELPVAALGELSHPADVVRDSAADDFVFEHHYGGRDRRWPRRGWVLLGKLWRKLWT
ncbi:MAG: glycosyltransferase family 2 protein [Halieaceae bacterium]|nr:glycosyltransferase family 2 protein [Halieaceae bacterium]